MTDGTWAKLLGSLRRLRRFRELDAPPVLTETEMLYARALWSSLDLHVRREWPSDVRDLASALGFDFGSSVVDPPIVIADAASSERARDIADRIHRLAMVRNLRVELCGGEALVTGTVRSTMAKSIVESAVETAVGRVDGLRFSARLRIET